MEPHDEDELKHFSEAAPDGLFSGLESGTYMVFAQIVDGDRTWTSDTLSVTWSNDDWSLDPYEHSFTGTWSQAASGAESVPEPTSGMLLLLGFAGLALKRKRA